MCSQVSTSKANKKLLLLCKTVRESITRSLISINECKVFHEDVINLHVLVSCLQLLHFYVVSPNSSKVVRSPHGITVPKKIIIQDVFICILTVFSLIGENIIYS